MEKQWVRKGTGVWLRMMTEEDTDSIVAWRNRDFVREQFIYQKPFTREGHLHWIETQVKTGRVVQMIICLAQDEKAVGSVYFRDIDREHRKAEYGIFIGEETALGKGIGTETAHLALDYAFHELSLHRVMLRVLSDNVRARKSYEHAGFIEEAYLHEDVFLQGGFRDVVLMASLNPQKEV
ncbi:MAG: GNAT family N-acetyltransferase [Lachnospiraceae bacterium]|nr:GNAT family N-acetyltransferase [Lachnospiraceae bacterium]